jgi:osmotically-inducible protein OsmY
MADTREERLGNDDRLREEIEQRLASTLVADPVDVAAVVRDGDVVLEGTVEDATQRTATEDCVRGVRGVRRVENRLRLRSEVDRLP